MSQLTMRAPCPRCACTEGTIVTRNGQDCVFCQGCNTWAYNAPRAETGREVRSLRTRPAISPGKRARILLRDNGTCVLCHRADVPIDIGHLISVNAGRNSGMTDFALFDDENLAAMCQPCNSGLSDEPVPLRIAVAILRTRLNMKGTA